MPKIWLTAAAALLVFSADCNNISLKYENPIPTISSTDYGVSAEYNRVINFTTGDNSMSSDGNLDKWPRCSQALQAISELSDNWNDNGASGFSMHLINLARDFLCALPFEPGVFPTARDSIQFEYENSRGDYLEFEIFDDGSLKVFSYAADGKSKTKHINIDEAVRAVEAFYGPDI